jgi:hypothetical protein
VKPDREADSCRSVHAIQRERRDCQCFKHTKEPGGRRDRDSERDQCLNQKGRSERHVDPDRSKRKPEGQRVHEPVRDRPRKNDGELFWATQCTKTGAEATQGGATTFFERR